MAPAAIEVEGVAKRFQLVKSRNSTLKGTIFNGFRRRVADEFWALDDVSFEVPEGSTFGLVGHNGSGKSTLLKCLAKIYRPDRGTLATHGTVSALLELGAGFHPELSGRDNVYLNASILGLGRKEVDRRFDDIVGFAGLERFIDSPVKNYSSGQFVRLGFAVAINVEPDILLVDEVLAVGDAEFQARCLAKFAEFRASGRTVVLVSHGMGNVRALCDQAVLLEHGKVVGEGTADEVVTQYLKGIEEPDHELIAHLPDWSMEPPGILDEKGFPVSEIETGGPVTFSCRVTVEHPTDLEIRFGLLRPGTAHVGRTSHACAIERGGTLDVKLHVASLGLVAGEYELHARAFDMDGIERAAPATASRFLVTDPDSEGHEGIVRLGGVWDLEQPTRGPTTGPVPVVERPVAY